MENKTQLISPREYCPNRKNVAFGMDEILLREVNREDEINHAGEPAIKIPKFRSVKVKRNLVGWINFSKVILLNNVRQLRP